MTEGRRPGKTPSSAGRGGRMRATKSSIKTTENEEASSESPSRRPSEGGGSSGGSVRERTRESRGGGEKFKVKLFMKFVLAISALLIVLLFVTGIVIGSTARSTTESEIEKRGYACLKMVIAVGEEFVYQSALALNEYQNKIRPNNEELGKLKKICDSNPSDKESVAEFDRKKEYGKQLNQEYEKQKKEIIGRFNYYLKKSMETDQQTPHGTMNNAFVTTDNYGRIEYVGATDIQGDNTYFPLDQSCVINKGYLTLQSGKTVRAWSFVKDFSFKNPIGGKDLGAQAIVVLSADRIDEIRSEITSTTFIVIIFGVIVGIGFAFFLSTRITRPISQLVNDITIVSKGNLEHRTTSNSNDEIGLLAYTFDVMTKNLKLAYNAEIENRAREHELGIAQEIQANLLPKKIPQLDGYDMGCFYLPSKEVGGDYYDYIQIDDQHLGIIVADVSGKGIPGSMVMTMARSLIRYEAQNNLDPVDTFIKVNRILARDIRRGMFVTAMYMILNIQKHTFRVASAGHNPMVIFRDRTKKIEEINPNGIALGFDKGPIFERTIKEETLQLFPGDRLALYTDGVVEAMSPENEEFGEDKFYKLCELNSHLTSSQYINIIVKALEKHRLDAAQSDDITISTLKLLKN
jgi:serine phosphatase RsbU (regulator of sigma subunit)